MRTGCLHLQVLVGKWLCFRHLADRHLIIKMVPWSQMRLSVTTKLCWSHCLKVYNRWCCQMIVTNDFDKWVDKLYWQMIWKPICQLILTHDCETLCDIWFDKWLWCIVLTKGFTNYLAHMLTSAIHKVCWQLIWQIISTHVFDKWWDMCFTCERDHYKSTVEYKWS